MPVIVGFNEFCAPDLATAFEQAVGQRAERVIVVTPMLTPIPARSLSKRGPAARVSLLRSVLRRAQDRDDTRADHPERRGIPALSILSAEGFPR